VAERLLSENAPDVAIADFHLRGGELSCGLIARLHEQGVPVILVSGSSESLSGLPVEPATILEKPFSEAQVLASLRPLLTHILVSRGLFGQEASKGLFFPPWLPPPCFQKSTSVAAGEQ
jgi:DNA-binding response OmpR family regulator